MPKPHGQDPGQGLSWSDYVDWLVETHGTLTAVADKLASARAFKDDVGSVERALRRLRRRGSLAGGLWGARALSAFGLPNAADARARWMGTYHSRFVDLPVPMCLDLLRLWDRPPLSEAVEPRTWLALGYASTCLRQADLQGAGAHLERARASFAVASIAARIEMLLVLAFIASRVDRERVGDRLDEAGALLETLTRPPRSKRRDVSVDQDDLACLRARYVDQRAYELTHLRPPALVEAEALYRTLPENAPAFALCRRANGLAYTRWKQGHALEAAELAREGVRHAGDGGHLRLRAMSLTMLSKIVAGTEEAASARARAAAIVTTLDDEGLRLRFKA